MLKGDLKAMFERRFDVNEFEQYDCKFIVQVISPPGWYAHAVLCAVCLYLGWHLAAASQSCMLLLDACCSQANHELLYCKAHSIGGCSSSSALCGPRQTHEVKNSYGSVLVSINFCSWIYPLATPSVPAEH